MVKLSGSCGARVEAGKEPSREGWIGQVMERRGEDQVVQGERGARKVKQKSNAGELSIDGIIGMEAT